MEITDKRVMDAEECAGASPPPNASSQLARRLAGFCLYRKFIFVDGWKVVAGRVLGSGLL
jgi:hypothetical protein